MLNYGIHVPFYRSEVVCIRHRCVRCSASQQRKWGKGWLSKRTLQQRRQLDLKPDVSKTTGQQCPPPPLALDLTTKLTAEVVAYECPLACLPLSVLLYDVLRVNDMEQLQLKQGYLLTEYIDGHPLCGLERARRRYRWHVWVECNGAPLDLTSDAKAVRREMRLHAGNGNVLEESVHLLKESLHESPPQDALFVDLEHEDPGIRLRLTAEYEKNTSDWERLRKDLAAGFNSTEEFWENRDGTDIAWLRNHYMSATVYALPPLL